MSYQGVFEMGTFNGLRDVDLSDRVVERLCRALVESDIDLYRRYPKVGIHDQFGPPLPDGRPNRRGIASLYDLFDAGKLRYFRPANIATPVGPEPAPDRWRDVFTLLDNGFGDCKDLSAARIAELTVRHGLRAQPGILKGWDQDDPETQKRLYHVVVDYFDPRLGRWVREDISAKMGMTSRW